jgi:hypothetical protein
MKDIKEIIRKVLKEQSGLELGEAKKKKKKAKRDACYHKVKSRYKVWPSAYGSGALVKCRKVGAKNWGNSTKEETLVEKRKLTKKPSSESSLKDWFGRKGAKGSTGGWVDCNAPDGKGGYKSCGRKEGEKRTKYPACRPTPAGCKSKGKGKKWGKKSKNEAVNYHLDKKIPLNECIFRHGSKGHLKFINDVRDFVNESELYVNHDERELLRTDLGSYGVYEGKQVPLDLPMINEQGFSWDGKYANEIDEEGADTSWSRDEDKVTLQDILELTKDIKTINLPTEKLAKIVLDWDDNPEEIERISQVEISTQYPILIMVDESGKIQWILDGNHRAQKALRSNSETIPAKLIKPSNLNYKSKKIFGLSEAEYKGKKVSLNKPKRGGSKAYYVYVKDPKSGNVKKVSFGSSGLRAKINNRGAVKSFVARHKCKQKNDKTKAGYWSCRLPRYAKSLGLSGGGGQWW